MSDSPVSLASLMTASKTVAIDFPGYNGMQVSLCYLAREELLNFENAVSPQSLTRKLANQKSL